MKSQIFGTFSAVALLAACASQNPAAATARGAATRGRSRQQEDLVANVGDRVFFDFNASSLRDDARSTLDRQSGWLPSIGRSTFRWRATVTIGEPRRDNLALGERRANFGRDYLVARGVAKYG